MVVGVSCLRIHFYYTGCFGIDTIDVPFLALTQLPLFATCDFLLEELPYLRADIDPRAGQEAEHQFAVLFAWMNKLRDLHPSIGFQTEKLAKKWAEGLSAIPYATAVSGL